MPRATRSLTRRWRAVRALRPQVDERDCGPACLSTILRYHGGDAPFARVRSLAATDSEGTSLASLAAAAETLGLTATGATGTIDDLAAAPLPAIAHVRNAAGNDHFMVVFAIHGGRVLVGDPASGVRSVSRREFDQWWRSRAVLLLEPTAALRREPQPGVLRWIARRGSDAADVWVSQILFAGIIYTLLALSVSVALQLVIDRVLPTHRESRLWGFAALLVGAQIFRAAIGYWRQRFVLEWAERIGTTLGTDFMSQLFALPIDFFESRTQGDLLTRVQDTARVQSAVIRVVGASVIDLLLVAGAAVYVVVAAPSAVGVMLVAGALFLVIAVQGSRYLALRQRAAVAVQSRFNASFVNGLQGIQDLQSFPAQRIFPTTTSVLFAASQRATRDLGRAQAAASSATEAVGGVALAVALAVCVLAVLRGKLALGQALGCYSAFGAMIPAILRLVEVQSILQGARVGAARLMEVEATQPDPALGATEHVSLDFSVFGLRDADFSWPKGEQVLRGATFAARRGRITAITGRSGAGKSTLVKVMQQKYELAGGGLELDGEPLDAARRIALRSRIAVVPESAALFTGTLASNVTLGRPFGGVSSLEDWIAGWGFGELLARLPDGVRTPIGEMGRQLSSGERQVVALLRALYGAPDILVVDEGLNTIDGELRTAAVQVLRQAARGAAVVLITHDMRLAAIADARYELRDGTIHELVTAQAEHGGHASTAPLALAT